jgi:hypothetical protein
MGAAWGQPSGALTPAMEKANMAETMTPEERQKHEAAIHALAFNGRRRFSSTAKHFGQRPVGIAEEARALLPDIDVSTALALYARSTSYMKALISRCRSDWLGRRARRHG